MKRTDLCTQPWYVINPPPLVPPPSPLEFITPEEHWESLISIFPSYIVEHLKPRSRDRPLRDSSRIKFWFTFSFHIDLGCIRTAEPIWTNILHHPGQISGRSKLKKNIASKKFWLFHIFFSKFYILIYVV